MGFSGTCIGKIFNREGGKNFVVKTQMTTPQYSALYR
jgi:hypothetical protein